MSEKNKGQASQTKPVREEKKKIPAVLVFLSAAVVVSMVLLGVYIWINQNPPPPNGTPPQGTPAITQTPTTAPDPVHTTTPEPTAEPDPTAEPTPTNEQAGNTASPTPTAVPTKAPGLPDVTLAPKPEFEPVKALYLKPGSFQNEKRLEHYIDLANRTEINAYVLDIKNDSGKLTYKSEIPDVLAAKASDTNIDIRKVINKLHENNIRVIGRIVAFKDGVMTNHRPDLAIKHNGKVFSQNGSGQWMDPTNHGSWEYIGAIVTEAMDFGFDEIQFDYVRFPETSLYQYELQNHEEGKERRDYIEGFIEYIRGIVPEGTILSADIFGWPLISTRDTGEIGQTVETIGTNLDYISPMVYPSHFDRNGQNINGIKFVKPDLQPYEVVYNTLLVGKKRIESVEGYKLKCRPYIQGFSAKYLPAGYWTEYGVEEYRAQIQAVYDAGYEEWIFWNAPNDYIEEAFLPE